LCISASPVSLLLLLTANPSICSENLGGQAVRHRGRQEGRKARMSLP
jgi:hypothetical protein